jgi:hypothetical protein
MQKYLKFIQTLNNIRKVCILPNMWIPGLMVAEPFRESSLCNFAPAGLPT